jgi:hypothetical protein
VLRLREGSDAVSTEDKLETVGNVWDSLSTGKKAGLAFFLMGSWAAFFGSGYGVALKLCEFRISAATAQHERVVTDLHQQILESRERDTKKRDEPTRETPIPYLSISVTTPGEDNLPKLSEAQPNDLSMSDFAKLHSDFAARTKDVLSLHMPTFFDAYHGKRFVWTGYVADVRKEGSEIEPEYCVRLRPGRREVYKALDEKKAPLDAVLANLKAKVDALAGFSTDCCFKGNMYDEMMNNLKKDQKVVVKGVMASSGRLKNCLFVQMELASSGKSGSE